MKRNHYHAHLNGAVVGYRTFKAVLDTAGLRTILQLNDAYPMLEVNPDLTRFIGNQLYLIDVVFSTGITDPGDHFIFISGGSALACRIPHLARHTIL